MLSRAMPEPWFITGITVLFLFMKETKRRSDSCFGNEQDGNFNFGKIASEQDAVRRIHLIHSKDASVALTRSDFNRHRAQSDLMLR